MRAFIAITPPLPILTMLEDRQQQAKQTLNDRCLRWTRRCQWHLTLHFLGTIERNSLDDLEQRLAAGSAKIEPFFLSSGEMGCFPNPAKPRVLWVGVKGDLEELTNLHSHTADARSEFGDHIETKPFHPHITLARIKQPPQTLSKSLKCHVQNQAEPPDTRWPVTHVDLIESELSPSGANYTTLARIPLKNPSTEVE